MNAPYHKKDQLAWTIPPIRQAPRLKAIYLCLIYFFSGTIAIGQSKDAVANGILKGKVKDSVYNFMLSSATIAVYKDSDSSLLQYTLPDNFGEFSVRNLPVNISLRLIITHVGYKDLVKKFIIAEDKKELGIGLLYMNQLARDSLGNMLEKVVVTAIAPMRMKGDTLEFNADAFKMDPNATTEDLMRRLPGIVIWGDGDITFNGKKIHQVLVDGKAFMGSSDITIATQNLPKNIIDKVQIYQKGDKRNPLDSTLYANLKLKEDKKMGYFGKVSAGLGASSAAVSADKRYTADGMLSGFNKKLQVSAIAATNNINKLAGNVDALLKNSSFKGEGASLDYQSDFNMRGLNRPVTAGLRLQSDLVNNTQPLKTSRLNADLFSNHNSRNIIHSNLEKNFITADTVLSRQSNSTSYNRSNDQRVSGNYTFNTDMYSLDISASGNSNEYSNEDESHSIQEKTGTGIINSIESLNKAAGNARNIQAGFSFTRQELSSYLESGKGRIPTGFKMGYNISAGDNTGRSESQSSYEFTNEPQRNRNVSRIYSKRDNNNIAHKFNISYPKLKELIFGKSSLGGINMELSTTYARYRNNSSDDVLDWDTTTIQFYKNATLTYNGTENSTDLISRLHLSKDFYKVLTNRYNKFVSLNFSAVQQYYNYNNGSTRAIQNIEYSYKKFIPDAFVEYTNHQFGAYEVKLSLGYNSSAQYPNVWQMAPVADVANPLYIPRTNKKLKPAYHQDINLKFNFNTHTPKNPWNITGTIYLGKTKDNISDSTLYDNGGARTVYMVNMAGNRYLRGNFNIRKSLAFNKHNTFEPGAYYDFSFWNNPQYIDTKLNVSINKNNGTGFHLNYRFKDIVQAKFEQGFYYNNGEQRGFNNNRFKSNNRFTRAIATLQFPKNLVWSSNITYNRSKADGISAVNFTIWNAGLTYRFLKGNQGEIKFTALDLLRQNKGVTNSVNGNVQNFGYTNVLQQYFMLTLAYFPRKFGK